jgi:hypothetical protein
MEFPTHFVVRYGASDFVREYAHNLSKGGLFIPDAEHLEPFAKVTIEIELPGRATQKVRAEVAHIVTAEAARAHGGRPGAGVALKRVPREFLAGLREYLVLLGRRADAVVLCADPKCGAALAEAGYRVEPLDDPASLADALARATAARTRVVGIVVPRRAFPGFEAAAVRGGAADRLLAMDQSDEADEALFRLDEQLGSPSAESRPSIG